MRTRIAGFGGLWIVDLEDHRRTAGNLLRSLV